MDERDVSRTASDAVGIGPGKREVEGQRDRISLWSSAAGTAQEFDDPREAGAAFFRADPAERPSVTHVEDNAARTMARTEIHSLHETGEPRYFKSLPDSHAPDGAFRAGFLTAMESSLAERLDRQDWGAAQAAERLDPRLKEDLEAFAMREPTKAAALWAERTDQPAPGPELRAAVQNREREGDQEEDATLESASDWRDPAKAISSWLTQTSASIDRLPKDRQDDLRIEASAIAREAATAFGLDRQRDDASAPPRSMLYGASLSATSLAVGAETVELDTHAAATLKAGLQAAATEAGIDGAKIERRLQSGAANAHEEESWVRSDIAEVAARHRLDMTDSEARGRAAELVDRFYEKAAGLVHAARGADLDRESLVQALGSLAKVHASQGAVAFRSEDQARDFAEAMQDRYGASVLKDMAQGRTEALAKDIPDPTARQAMSAAVVAAAKEHPALGLSAHEAETAERTLAAQAISRERQPDHARDHGRDREF